MNGTTTIIVEAPGSSTGVILGGVSLSLVLSTLLGLAIYALRKGGFVTSQQIARAEKIAEDADQSSPVVAAATASAPVVDTVVDTVVETARVVVHETPPIFEKAIDDSSVSGPKEV